MTEEKTPSEVVREGLERACKDFTERIAPLGFRRSKRLLWTRPQALKVDRLWFHRHGSSYGAPQNFSINIRVHFEMSAVEDAADAAVVSGPFSDVGRIRAGRYHLRFNAKSGDTYDRCLDDLVRFVKEQGEPWFARFPSFDELARFVKEHGEPWLDGLSGP